MNYDVIHLDLLLSFLVDKTNEDQKNIFLEISEEVQKKGWSKETTLKLDFEIKKIIPKGSYCYNLVDTNKPNPSAQICIFWDCDSSKNNQESGYCHLLQSGDWLENKINYFVNSQTGDIQTPEQIGLPLSLLWDQCKECGINCDLEEDELID